MTKLICSNYGFDCDYVAKGEIEQTIDDFKKHTFEEHGIDYSKETLMQFVNRADDYP
jgi:predicted small metal-binding protein